MKEGAHVLSGYTILGGGHENPSPRIKITDKLSQTKLNSSKDKFQTIVNDNYNERYMSELNPKNINFRASNVLTGSQMKIHKDEKMVDSINAVL